MKRGGIIRRGTATDERGTLATESAWKLCLWERSSGDYVKDRLRDERRGKKFWGMKIRGVYFCLGVK